MAGPPEHFAIRTIVSGLDEPTAVAYGPDGRVFITEKWGRVKVLAHGKVHEFLDLRDEVNATDDRGLNNLIIDKRGRLYLFFTEELRPDDPDRRHPAGGRLIRIEASARNPNRADPESRVTLISGFDSRGPWHSVGGLDFDKKGNLVLAFGDGAPYHPKDFSAAGLVTYDLDALNGKVLRIDAESGHGIPMNPYFDADRPDSVRSKVIARGFRMPYRLVVDRVTGTIYVGDVGTDQYEEIDLIPVSAAQPDTELNYGWPCYEGGAEGEPVRRYLDESACVSNYYSAANERQLTKAPLYAYSGKGGAALILGPLYRGGPYPEAFDGKLVFADWVRDRFWTYADGEVADFGSEDWGAPTDIEVTPDGTIAYTAFSYIGNAPTRGQVKEIVYLGRSGTVVAPWMFAALGASVVVLAFVYWKRRRRLRV
jgi:glucose/arabinose dehydrogenase